MVMSRYATHEVITKVLNGDFEDALKNLELFSNKGNNGKIILDEGGKQLFSFIAGVATSMSWQERLSEETTEKLALGLVKMVNVFAFMEEILKLTNAKRSDERFRYRNLELHRFPFDVYYALRDNKPKEDHILEEIENFDSEALKTLLVFLLDSGNIMTLNLKFFEPIMRAIFRTNLVPNYQILVCLLKSQI